MKSSRPVLKVVMAVVVGLLGVGCTSNSGPAAAPAPTPASHSAAAAQHLPRLITTFSNAGGRARAPSGAAAERRAVFSGVDRFCRAWYVDQRAASQKYPNGAQERRFAAAMVMPDRLLTQKLRKLRVPSALTTQFDGLVANEERMVGAWQKRASADPTTRQEGMDEFDTALVLRHAYGRQFQAPDCDGLLPPAQERAAERAVQRFDLTTNPDEGCVSLVTPEFVRADWGESPDPMATCRKEFQIHRLGSLPVPRNIRIQSVTGVENLTATVTYREVPDCGCGTFTTRLFFEDGRWLIHSVTTGP